MRKIAVLTGKRGGYGAMKPLLRAIDSDQEMELQLIITDQHVNKNFGGTRIEIEKEFIIAAAVDMEQSDGDSSSRVKALGTCLYKMTDTLTNLMPDIIVLYGDRGEVLVTAIAAANLKIPIAHLQGGDVSGNIDELMRHSTTKLSHLHFPSTKESAERIIRMGEEEWRVQYVGDNHVDLIVSGEYMSFDELRSIYNVEEKKYIILLQHPETTRNRNNYNDIKVTLSSVLKRDMRLIIIYPCSDQGYDEIVSAIEEIDDVNVSVHKNIDAYEFWGLMKSAAFMIGNSSAGLIETPYFNLPTINLGKRQVGRMHSTNLINADYIEEEINCAIDTIFMDEKFKTCVTECDKPFGDGYAWKRIHKVLSEIDINDVLLDKKISY